jgi:hypothetical protein
MEPNLATFYPGGEEAFLLFALWLLALAVGSITTVLGLPAMLIFKSAHHFFRNVARFALIAAGVAVIALAIEYALVTRDLAATYTDPGAVRRETAEHRIPAQLTGASFVLSFVFFVAAHRKRANPETG